MDTGASHGVGPTGYLLEERHARLYSAASAAESESLGVSRLRTANAPAHTHINEWRALAGAALVL